MHLIFGMFEFRLVSSLVLHQFLI